MTGEPSTGRLWSSCSFCSLTFTLARGLAIGPKAQADETTALNSSSFAHCPNRTHARILQKRLSSVHLGLSLLPLRPHYFSPNACNLPAPPPPTACMN